MFAFDLYDNDNSGEIDIGEVELLLKEVYGREFQASTQAQTIVANLKGKDLGGLEKNINVEVFREFCRTHPAVLYPAFVLQQQMQEKILGTKFWNACSNSRVQLSSGKQVGISEILNAHISKKVLSHRMFELLSTGSSGGLFNFCFNDNPAVKLLSIHLPV